MNRIATVALFSLLIAGVAGAQTFEVGVGGAYTRIGKKDLGSIADQNVQDDDTKLKGKYGYGARFTINTPGYYGHEIGYFLNFADLTTKTRPDTKAPDFVLLRQDRIRIQELSYNFLIYMMPKGERRCNGTASRASKNGVTATREISAPITGAASRSDCSLTL
jgi:hypothetical protein